MQFTTYPIESGTIEGNEVYSSSGTDDHLTGMFAGSSFYGAVTERAHYECRLELTAGGSFNSLLLFSLKSLLLLVLLLKLFATTVSIAVNTISTTSNEAIDVSGVPSLGFSTRGFFGISTGVDFFDSKSNSFNGTTLH